MGSPIHSQQNTWPSGHLHSVFVLTCLLLALLECPAIFAVSGETAEFISGADAAKTAPVLPSSAAVNSGAGGQEQEQG